MPLSLFTSESVTEGHPDKVCDQISDAILDAILTQDPDARVAVEAFATTGAIHIGGEVSTTATVDYDQIARRVLRRIGYVSSEIGMDADTCAVLVSVASQSADISRGVDRESIDTQGAGDQGMMFGYACNHTPELMPVPISLAHTMARSLATLRGDHPELGLRPDGKTQVTVAYEGHRPVEVTNVVLSTQHDPDAVMGDVREAVEALVIQPALEAVGIEGAPVLHLNPTGRFVKGGPAADAGLTGRKIIVDTYGGMARHGGGAFSGKDPSKVDRSAAYAMRWVAKHIVEAGLAERCELQVAYAIGVAAPVSIRLETFGTEREDPARILRAVETVFDLRPGHIIHDLSLARPIYSPTSVYGHFGQPGLPWENTTRITDLLDAL